MKFVGFGILSLFLVMLVPAYGEVTEFSIENIFYTIDEGIVFVGTVDDDSQIMINMVVENPNGKESYFVGAMSNSEGSFKTVPKNVNENFSIIGTYQFTAFTIQKDNGVTLPIEFDGDKIFIPIEKLLQLNPIQDKIIEVGNTVTFTATISDDSFIETYSGLDPVYSLENQPAGATIDSRTGQFVWTPTTSHGNIEDVNYNFDIIVNANNQDCLLYTSPSPRD